MGEWDEPTRMPGCRADAAVVNFGLALPMVSRGMSARQLLSELLEEVTAAETAGFDVCLVPEHHGGPLTALSDPMMTVAWLLARTNRIKVGTGVLILPLHSVARLAEQTNLLQQASGGRFVLGVGAGYQPADFATFHVDMSDRGQAMSDGIASLRSAWSAGVIDGHPIRPALGDQPAPALFVGAWTKEGIRRAALRADGWIADPIRSTAEITDAARAYRSLAGAADRKSHVMVMREAWIADSDELAISTFSPIVEPIFHYYLQHGAFPAGTGLKAADLTLAGALADRVLCGSPETLTDQITEIVELAAADTVVLGIRHPHGPEHSQVLAAIERFGGEVLPAVRSRLKIGQKGKTA
jgi:alkanesulfonate monooxygenase SsuD/methylene tetrahydromethanopterin reductase-like flavin-dependent oxidoreductase (luciferase family)